MADNVNHIITGLIWSVKQLQKLIPDGKEWDSKTQSICNHMERAENFIRLSDVSKYPYLAWYNGKEFVPTMIDYDNKMAWMQISQVSGDGEWISFEDLALTPNPYFTIK